MGCTWRRGLAASVVALASAAALLAGEGAGGGLKAKRRTMADYLRGKWDGPASLDSGRMAGTKMQWSLDAPDGDLRKAKGVIVNKLDSITLGAASIERRVISFTAHYDVGGRAFKMDCNGHFDGTYTVISGTCSGMIGKGKFELTKTIADLDPKRVAGEWAGETTPSGEGGKPLPFTLTFGAGKDGVSATFMADRGFTVEQAKASIYDDADRRLDLFLVIVGKGKAARDAVHVQGQFDEGLAEFAGTYESASAGKGAFKLARAKKKE